MSGRRGAATAAVAVVVGVTGWGGVAVAAPPPGSGAPDWAGPPTVETFDLADDPISFLCGERRLVFTAGELVIRGRALPGERFRDTRLPRNATAVDQFGTVYRVQGSAGVSFDAREGREVFRLTGSAVGPAGTTETINSRFVFERESTTAVERGTCTVVFS